MTVVPMFDDLGHKQCCRCRAIKPLQEFPATLRKNGSVKFGAYCRPCQRAHQHEWYLAHREQALAAAAARREREPPVRRDPRLLCAGLYAKPSAFESM